MLRRILGTVGTRYLIAVFNLALIFINAKVLGVEGVATIGLILASVNIAVIFNGIFSGNTLVYFMNRYAVTTLVFPPMAGRWPGRHSLVYYYVRDRITSCRISLHGFSFLLRNYFHNIFVNYLYLPYLCGCF